VPPSSATITDGSGNIWSVAGGQIYENGNLSPVTKNVILLFYWNGKIYQQTSLDAHVRSGVNTTRTLSRENRQIPRV
jgi:hypothetical protein